MMDSQELTKEDLSANTFFPENAGAIIELLKGLKMDLQLKSITYENKQERKNI